MSDSDERDLLRVLAQAPPADLWEEAMRKLDAHRFKDPAHQVAFEALRRIGNRRPEIVRAQLPRQMVVAGFPGFGADELLEQHGLNEEEMRALVSRVAAQT